MLNFKDTITDQTQIIASRFSKALIAMNPGAAYISNTTPYVDECYNFIRYISERGAVFGEIAINNTELRDRQAFIVGNGTNVWSKYRMRVMDAAETNLQKIADLHLRWIAYIIDGAVIGLLRVILELLNIPDIALSENSFLITQNIFLLILMFLYVCVLPLFLSGRTLGKLAMGIRIVTVNGSPLTIWTLFLRNWLGYIVSGLVMGIGFLWALSNKNHQTWHDILSKTVVVRDETSQLNFN